MSRKSGFHPIAGFAAFVVVITGCYAFYNATNKASLELVGPAAAFAIVGLYLLFGRKPPA